MVIRSYYIDDHFPDFSKVKNNSYPFTTSLKFFFRSAHLYFAHWIYFS